MKICYITERNTDSVHVNGSSLRDIRLINILESFSTIKKYYINISSFNKYNYIYNNNHHLQVISEINSENFDIIIISTFPISPYLYSYNNLKNPKIFYFCDSSFHIYNNISFLNIIKKAISFILKYKENKILSHNFCAYLGDDEIKQIPNHLKPNTLRFPFSVNLNNNLYNNNGHLIFVGDYNFWPNLKALKILIKLCTKIDRKIIFYGTNLPSINKLPDNIIFRGYVKNINDIYDGAYALLYPISYGTGIKNKVVESMSYGIPVIGFPNAFTNLNVTDGKHCIMCRSLKHLVNIINCSRDLTLISNNCHKFICEELSFYNISKSIKSTINDIVKVS